VWKKIVASNAVWGISTQKEIKGVFLLMRDMTKAPKNKND
jgi:hypothetical protein